MIKKEGKDFSFVSSKRIDINLRLLGTAFAVFTFIIALRPAILKDNIPLALQLTLAIPLLITSTLVRTKQYNHHEYKNWNAFGYATFILAYTMMINVVGILLSVLVSLYVGLVFFFVNMLMAVIYSYFEVYYDRQAMKSRLYKDLFFLLMLILLGVYPSVI